MYLAISISQERWNEQFVRASKEHPVSLLGIDETPYFSTEALEIGLDFAAEAPGVKRPEWGVRYFSEVVKAAQEYSHEGFVVYGQSSKTSLKIKSPYYLTLKACARKKDILSLDKQRVDEEYFDLVDHLKSLSYNFNSMDEQARLKYILNRIYNVV